MGFNDVDPSAGHVVQQTPRRHQPAAAPQCRATENRARPLSTSVLLSSESNGNVQQHAQKTAGARASPAAAAATVVFGNPNPKRRLRPMELKQQQRQQKERRKRVKLLASDAARGSHTAISPAGFRDSRGAPRPAAGPVAAAAARGSERRLGTEPLTRSASSPPSISCAKGPMSDGGARLSPVPHRRNATPPRRHPLDLMGGFVEESRHADVPPPPALSKEETAAAEGMQHLCSAVGSNDSNRGSSRGARVVDGGDGDGDGDDEVAAGLSRQQHTEHGSASFGASGGVGGRGGGGGSASLFAMVMSGASNSSQQSCGRGSCGGGLGRGDSGTAKSGGENGVGRARLLSVAATTGAPADRGKPIASSLFAMLGGNMRVGKPPPVPPPTGISKTKGDGWLAGSGGSGETGARGGGGGGGGDPEVNWMAMNLEELSNFRVPETRMGFTESAREGLPWSATAPSLSSGLFREQKTDTGGEGSEGGRLGEAAEGRAGEPRWQFGCLHPWGRQRQAHKTTVAAAAVIASPAGQAALPTAAAATAVRTEDAAASFPPPPALPPRSPPPDLPLRTRVRFEMAPGVHVPHVIKRLPAHLDFRALKAFAAGEPGVDAGAREGKGGREWADIAGAPARPPAAEEEDVTNSSRSSASVMEEWRKATLYFAHPAAPLPQEALAQQKVAQMTIAKNPAQATRAQDSAARPGGSAASGWTSFFWSRRREWEQAFASLYYGLISSKGGGGGGDRNRGHGSHPAKTEGFYLQCPLYTVLWRLVWEEAGTGEGGSSGRWVPAAALTRSTRRLRKRLTAAGVDFKMPLDPAGDRRDAQADEDVLQEWKALDATGNAKPGATYANEEDRSRPHLSLLTFRGHMAVHGLFDFLLEACGNAASGVGGVGVGVGAGSGTAGGTGGTGGDVPLLLSREPFLNASLKALKVRQNGPMHRYMARAPAGDESTVEVLELVGYVLPSVFADLSLAMASACIAAGSYEHDGKRRGGGGGGGGGDGDGSDDDSGGDEDDGEGGEGEGHDEAVRGGGGSTAAVAGTAGRADDEGGNEAEDTERGAGPGGAAMVPNGGAGGGEKNSGDSTAACDGRDGGREGDAAEGTSLHVESKPLFRAVGSVDPDTAHLNAGFAAMESATAAAAAAVTATGRGCSKGDGTGTGGEGEKEEAGVEGRRRWQGESSCYCKETRARLLVPSGRRGAGRRRRGLQWQQQQQQQQQRDQRVVFDVCSIDPAGATALMS